ncbi:unnamed protein product [Dicrocoelium dendriticum]|nr:unnamed protein product [Dicrocoelium dendriticum]
MQIRTKRHVDSLSQRRTFFVGRRYRESVLKFIYLTCLILITVAFIVQCILLHLVIMPYRHESGFTQTICTYIGARIVSNAVRCENRCSKNRSSFQCLRVVVAYAKRNKTHTASLFENIATYQYYHTLGCATSSCHRQNMANRDAVERFHNLVQRLGVFTCYTHHDHVNEAIMHKFYAQATLYNALFWPLGILILSGTVLAVLWSHDRCEAWGDEVAVLS